MRRIGRLFGSSSSSSSSRAAENDQRRDRDADRSRRGSDVNPRFAGLSSRPTSPASRPASPPRALSNQEHMGNRDIQNQILPNLINVRNQCANNPALERTYRRAAKGVQHAQDRLAGNTRTRSRDELAEMLEKCRRELEHFTSTQYQAVRASASESYAPGESTLPGSHAHIPREVMNLAMGMLFNYETMVNPVRMNEWQRTKVGNLLKDIANNEPVSHAAVYNAYQVRDNPRALIETLVAHVSR
ncbi:putative secreted protein [Xanthomonas bromi]|uniref:Putative secreted protein n=1 Tax=Xanthomonas bromi TaxID=56449 RepID=A0A1C3NKE9_9XANT|nr:putative secreted protein [Xanthomonas bromi]